MKETILTSELGGHIKSGWFLVVISFRAQLIGVIDADHDVV
jgi:hypothetical protein